MGQPEGDERHPAERDVTVPTFALQYLQEAAFVINERGGFEYVNEEACRSLGYSREELLAMGVPDISPSVRPEDFPGLWTELLEIRSIRFEDQHRTRDGRLIPVEINSNYFEHDGRGYSLALARDISDRKRTEAALLVSQDRFGALFNQAAVPLCFLSRTGATLSFNGRFQTTYGYSPEEVPTLHEWWERAYPDPTYRQTVRQACEAAMEKALAEHTDVEPVESQATCKNGQVRTIIFSGSAVGDDLLLTFFDVTARKAAEQRLHASEQMFRAIVENSPEIIMRFDRHCRHIYVNPAMERGTGMTPEWLLGRMPMEAAPADCPEAVASAASAQAAIQRVLQAGENVEIELTLIAPDGHPHFYSARFSPEFDTDGRVASVVSVAADITEQRKAEAQLRLAQKMEGIGRLSGGIAHDFNNALGVILGESELMAERLEPGHPLREELEEIRRAGEHAASLTRQLLAFSRQQVLQPRVVNLNTVVAEIEKMLRRLIGEDIEMVTSLSPDLGYTTADPGQIEQVITNLAVNARDAMPAGGRFCLETHNVVLDEAESAQHGSVDPGPYVLLTVSDTGSGIPREMLSNIFEPFFTTKEVGKGTGLGLATVYGIVHQTGGHISVSSDVGQGTTFRIFLPRVEAPADSLDAEHGRELARGAETVLLVEDYEPLRKLTLKLLRSSGYTVVEAANAAGAIQTVAQMSGPIHLLISDVVMPGMSGPQLAQLLVAQKPQMRVLLMSGYTDEAVARHGVLSPGAAFLQKPFTREALTRKVREVLAAPAHYAQLV